MKHVLCVAAIGVLVGSIAVYREIKHYAYFASYPVTTEAVAVVYPTQGNVVSGVVLFAQSHDGLVITATVTGLTPGEHGFHIHAMGDCSCADAVCAGAHFNPTHQPHGGPAGAIHHVGDLGNIIADDQGVASYRLVSRTIQLNGPQSIIGRSVIIHADPDDLVSQPTGNAGARVGCGVIGIKS